MNFKRVLICFVWFVCEIEAFVSRPRPSPSTYSTTTVRFPARRNKKWSEQYEELVQFYRQNGHTDVTPANADESLKNFVQNQRKEFRKWQQGLDSTMTDEKVELLNQLEFIWNKNQEIWDCRFRELLQFKAEYGHINVPIKYKTLGQWVTKQRRAERSGTLDQENVERLKSIGFIWDVKEWQFKRMLKELQDFKATNGHLRIKITDGELGSWFYSRRKEYLQYLNGKNTTLTESHRQTLENLGFGPELGLRRDAKVTTGAVPWETRFEELVEFKNEFNHTRVPRIPKYAQLSSWVNHQRNLKALGQLPHYRLVELEAIGFVWNTNTWLWMERFAQLEKYQEKYGNTNVPRGFGDLGEWVDWQRVQFASYEKGKKSQITAQRVALLNSIGFDWNRGETRRIEWDLSWHRNLAQLKRWKEKHGDCNVSRASEPALGLWVAQQRSNYKKALRGEKTTLTDERIAQLVEIGILERAESRQSDLLQTAKESESNLPN